MSRTRDEILNDVNRASEELRAFDANAARTALRFDQPPVLPYPRLLFKAGEEPIRVQNDAQRDAKLAEGWALTLAEIDDTVRPKAKK